MQFHLLIHVRYSSSAMTYVIVRIAVLIYVPGKFLVLTHPLLCYVQLHAHVKAHC